MNRQARLESYIVCYVWTFPITFTILAALVSFPTNTYAQTALRIKLVARSEPTPLHQAIEDRTTIIYAQGGRIRTESPAFGPFPALVLIQRCDLGVMYVLNGAKRQYTEQLIRTPEQQSQAATEAEEEERPNWTIETRTVDTGETKAAFGHTARHYITTIKQTPSPELGRQPGETVIDAWYLDIPDITRCQPASRPHRGFIGDAAAAQKFRQESGYSGPEPQGLVLSEKRTQSSFSVRTSSYNQERSLTPTSRTSSREIVELSEAPVDAAVFEVPQGFVKVERITP